MDRGNRRRALALPLRLGGEGKSAARPRLDRGARRRGNHPPPILLAIFRPGTALTRYVIAASQMLSSALLIHLTGGRIETHFHVFGSLAFLAFYLDWKVILTATVVVAADHFARGVFWPESVYGVANPEWWRFLEHAGWVAFEDVFLIWSCIFGQREFRVAAERQAEMERLSEQEQLKSAALEMALSEIRTATA